MKGPYERLKYDLRRVWECPQCQSRQRTDGTITGLVCDCQKPVVESERVSMQLVHDGIRRSSVKQPQPSAPPAALSAEDSPETDAETNGTTSTEAPTAGASDEPSSAGSISEVQANTAEGEAASSGGEESSENSEPSKPGDEGANQG